jgi:hypothetical protein
MLFAHRKLLAVLLALVAGLVNVGRVEAGHPVTEILKPACFEPPVCHEPPHFDPPRWDQPLCEPRPIDPPHWDRPAPVYNEHVKVFLRGETVVIVGTNREDAVTITRFGGITAGATPVYEVYVNGSRRPKLTFPVLNIKTGRRVSTIFMDGNDGFDKLFIDSRAGWKVRTKSVEERGNFRPAR